MYVPAPFVANDLEFALEVIAANPFGVLVTCGHEFPQVTHLPMLARGDGDRLVIAGHVARANPHARAILDCEKVTAVFTGPHAYVSAAWYERPAFNVPTWNYVAVHASGRLAACDADTVLEALAETFEGGRPDPWRFDRMDAEYRAKQLAAIVAFELRVDRLDCAAKLSQNRSHADHERVIAELSESLRESDRACADAMRATLAATSTSRRA